MRTVISLILFSVVAIVSSAVPEHVPIFTTYTADVQFSFEDPNRNYKMRILSDVQAQRIRYESILDQEIKSTQIVISDFINKYSFRIITINDSNLSCEKSELGTNPFKTDPFARATYKGLTSLRGKLVQMWQNVDTYDQTNGTYYADVFMRLPVRLLYESGKAKLDFEIVSNERPDPRMFVMPKELLEICT